jgi:hypothetical protein
MPYDGQDILTCDSTMLSGSAYSAQIDSDLACKAADGWSGGNDLIGDFCNGARHGLGNSRCNHWLWGSDGFGGQRSRCRSNRSRCDGSRYDGHRSRRCGDCWGGDCWGGGCWSGLGSRWWGTCTRPRGFDRPDQLPDLERIAFSDRDTKDLTRKRTWNSYGGLVGFEFQQGLLELDHITDLDIDLQHIAGFDTFAQTWQFDFCSHGG